MNKIFLLLAVVVSSNVCFGQTNAGKHLNLSKNKVALDGYDPVAYFKMNKALEGKKEITATYEGAVYLFSNQNNKNLFAANPSSYLPQYGGWCAYAMGEKGEKVEVDPETFKIVDGKLYLFYNRFFNNTLDSWNENEGVLKLKANKNWSKFLTQH